MYVGKVDISLTDDGLKIETVEFAEDTGIMIKNLETDETLLCLESKELIPLIKLLEKADSMLKSNEI